MRRFLLALTFSTVLASLVALAAVASAGVFRDTVFRSADGSVVCWAKRDVTTGRWVSVNCMSYPRATTWGRPARDCGDISFLPLVSVGPEGKASYVAGCTGGAPWNPPPARGWDPARWPVLPTSAVLRAGPFRCRGVSRSALECLNPSRGGFVVSASRIFLSVAPKNGTTRTRECGAINWVPGKNRPISRIQAFGLECSSARKLAAQLITYEYIVPPREWKGWTCTTDLRDEGGSSTACVRASQRLKVWYSAT